MTLRATRDMSRERLIISSFYRGSRNREAGRLSNLPKVPQLVNGRAGTTQFSVLSDLPSSPLLLPSSSPELPSGHFVCLEAREVIMRIFPVLEMLLGKGGPVSVLICVLGFGGDKIES